MATSKEIGKMMHDRAKEGAVKIQEILDNIRSIHGTEVGDAMTIWANTANHLSQLDTTVIVSVMEIRGDEPTDLERMARGALMALQLHDRSKHLCAGLFSYLMDKAVGKEKRIELTPFAKQINNIVDDVSDTIIDVVKEHQNG